MAEKKETTYIEENDSNVGQDLALHEKIKEEIKKSSKQGQENINPVLEIGGTLVEFNIEKDSKKNSYKISVLGVHILSLDENDELSFVDGWQESLMEKMENYPDTIDKEAIIKDLEEMEKNLAKEKEEQQKAEEDLSEDMEEKAEEEAIDEEEKDEEDLSEDIEEKDGKEENIDEEKKQIAKRYGVSPNQVIHISLNQRSKRVTHKDTMAGLTKWSEKYDDIFILPGEDEYSWQTVGIDKNGKEELIDNKQIEGKNPNIKIKILDENSSNKELKEVRPLAIYELDSHSAYAIVRDSSGKTQALYCRQEEGKGKEYWGMVIPEAQGKNVKEASVESRDAISSEYYSSYDLAKRGESFEKAKSLEERGFPSKEGKGVQMEEIKGTPEQNRENYIKAIVEKLAEAAVASSAMPMAKTAYIKIHGKELMQRAERILEIGNEDSDITYEEAIKKESELSKAQKEEKEKQSEGEKIPGQKRGME